MTKAPDNLFAALPQAPVAEAFDTLLQNAGLRVERIVSRGHASPPGFWYEQSENEWVLLLRGEARLTVEGQGDCRLVPGSYLHLPARTRHRVEWTLPDAETVWLAIHY